MTARLCNVDLRAGEYIVQTYSETEDGFWIQPATRRDGYYILVIIRSTQACSPATNRP